MTTEITAAIIATDAVAIRAEAATIRAAREVANTTDSIRGEEVQQNLSTFPDDRWFFNEKSQIAYLSFSTAVNIDIFFMKHIFSWKMYRKLLK